MSHKYAKGEWNPVKHPGSEAKRAQEHGRTLQEQARIDSHSSNKRIRGKGIFALNAEEGAFRHPKRKATKKSIRTPGASRAKSVRKSRRSESSRRGRR